MATADEGEAHESESPNKGRKPKKKVEYAFGTPTHSVNAYSAYAHLRSIDNVDFAKGLSQSGENLFASSERGARSITSTISPPTAAKKKLTTLSSNNMGASIKITEQNACQRKDCREVVKALLAGQIRIDAEKEEIVDELDRLTAEMREMETTLETYESRQKALHIENIQLESLNEKQLEKSRTLEDAKRALQREQDTFSQTLASLETERGLCSTKLRDARSTLSNLMWRGTMESDHSRNAPHMSITKLDPELIQDQDSVSSLNYNEMSRADVVDCSERKKVIRILPEYLELSALPKVETLTDATLNKIRSSSSYYSLQSNATSPISTVKSMMRSKASHMSAYHSSPTNASLSQKKLSGDGDVLRSRLSFLAGSASNIGIGAHATLQPEDDHFTSIGGGLGGGEVSKNRRQSGAFESSNSVHDISMLSQSTFPGAGGSGSSVSGGGKSVYTLSPVKALKRRQRHGKFSSASSRMLPNDEGYQGYTPSGSFMYRAGGLGKLANTALCGKGGGRLGDLSGDYAASRNNKPMNMTASSSLQHSSNNNHHSHSNYDGQSVVSSGTFGQSLSMAGGGSQASYREEPWAKLDPVFYRDQARASWGHAHGIVGKIREKNDLAEGEYGIEVKDKFLTFRHPSTHRFGKTLTSL